MVTCQKSFYYRQNRKQLFPVPESYSCISFSKFSVSRHLLKLFYGRVTQFFYLLCSQFRQKASGWINKTLLLIKQQKWLSEFCVKIDRVASKNQGQIIADEIGQGRRLKNRCRSGDCKHTYFFVWPHHHHHHHHHHLLGR